MWSKAGQLDWWVKTGRNGWVGYAVQTAVNGGSELLIFVRSKETRIAEGYRDVSPSCAELACEPHLAACELSRFLGGAAVG